MIKSMTGFGRGELETELGHLSVEVRSVNSRTCNVNVRLPEVLLSLESQISSYVRSRVSRGQVNVSIVLDSDNTLSGRKVVIDRELLKEYCEQMADVKEYLSISEPVSLNAILALPGVINVEEPKADADRAWLSLQPVLVMAVDQFIETREAEGAATLVDLSSRLETISLLTDQTSERAPEVIDYYRQRLQKRIGDLLRDQVTVDESRIAMEVAIMAERCDITEEIIRLKSHVEQMRYSLEESDGPVGRHLDFILQEVNREVNTIASKANDVQISADCIRLKDETDKMREQVQNIE
jgi:uncharacterized protein (TIGR00255 family)